MDSRASALVALRPRLFHVTSPDAHNSLFRDGLLSTASLLASYGWHATDVDVLITTPRTDFVPITSPEGRAARLSHQKPININMLRKCLHLTDTSQADYFRLLANRVFFFTTDTAASGFSRALLRAGPIDVLTIDTFALLRGGGANVEVSRYNSGSSPRSPLPKGPDTWQSLDEFDGRASQIKEVTVIDRVKNVEALALSVVRVHEDGSRRRIWP
jgi:hypothetical protein